MIIWWGPMRIGITSRLLVCVWWAMQIVGLFTDSQIREMTWLVRQLQQQFQIPSEYVFVDVGAGDQPPVGVFGGAVSPVVVGR